MKPLAPRKHTNVVAPEPAGKKPKEVVSMTTNKGAFLGVLTPALSDLAVLTRVDGILEQDRRSDAEVSARWSHLAPVVQAFYERMGLQEQLKASLPRADSPSADRDPHNVPPPPDPGALSLSGEEEPVTHDATEDDSEEEPEDDSEEDSPAVLAGPGRVDAESHSRLQSDGAGDGLHDAARMLYDDVLWLFNINDGEGALISLERLLTMGQIDDEVAEFLDLNGAKLLGLYEGYIGPFDKVLTRGSTSPESMPEGYLSHGEFDRIYAMVDGQKTIADMIDASERTPLETCASIEQLHRARLLEI
jgi:hypothetical protein